MKFAPALLGLALAALPACAEHFLVLPFFNYTGDANLNWIGESIAENIRDTLAAERMITVDREDRQEACRRLGLKPYSRMTKATVIKVAEAVDAEQVIFGGFQLEPSKAPESRGTLRITAQILDLRRIRGGPEFLALGALEDLATLQTHLAWQTLQFVAPGTSPGEEEFRRKRPPSRVDAMEYYVRGLLAQNDDQKLHLFAQAARLDPRFSRPCLELGRLYWKRRNYKAAADWFERVEPTAGQFREATFFLGASRFYLGESAAAEAAFARVLTDLPLNEVLNNLGAAQARRSAPEALENFRKAHEGDRNEPVYLFNIAYTLWKTGQFDEAAKWFRDLLERDPSDTVATTLLGRCLQKSGPRPGEPAIENIERLKHEFEESAYLQLRSILEGERKP